MRDVYRHDISIDVAFIANQLQLRGRMPPHISIEIPWWIQGEIRPSFDLPGHSVDEQVVQDFMREWRLLFDGEGRRVTMQRIVAYHGTWRDGVWVSDDDGDQKEEGEDIV